MISVSKVKGWEIQSCMKSSMNLWVFDELFLIFQIVILSSLSFQAVPPTIIFLTSQFRIFHDFERGSLIIILFCPGSSNPHFDMSTLKISTCSKPSFLYTYSASACLPFVIFPLMVVWSRCWKGLWKKATHGKSSIGSFDVYSLSLGIRHIKDVFQ